MNKNWMQFIEIGLAVLASLASLFAALRLRRNAEKHEHTAQVLDEKIKQALVSRI
jgi:CHASE3 domain sensor protein